MELSTLEKKLQSEIVTPKFTTREDKGFSVNNQLANQIAKTLNLIKGRNEEEIGSSGDLDIEEFIQFDINRKCKIINDLDIFSEEFEQTGLDLTLLIDCSGSMRGLRQRLADLSATLVTALKKCPFINFKILAFSAEIREYIPVLEVIKSVNECGKIHADETDLHDMHNLGIDYAVKDLQDNGNSEHKKLIFMITDGYPEGCYKREYIEGDILQSLMERSVVNARNYQIPIFCFYYGHIGKTKEKMQKMFKNMLFESENFEDIGVKLIKKLELAVDNLNKGAVL